MASRREYEMLFRLNAQLSNTYTNSFKSAQNPIAEMQRCIEGLNKLQSDISSYQKQQEAIEKTKSKLATLRAQYENLQKEEETAGGASVDLKNKMLDKQQQIEKTSASLSNQTSKLGSMGEALTGAGVDTNNLKAASANLDTQINTLKADQEEAATSATNSIQNIEQVLAAAGIVKGLKEIYDAIKACTDASIEFESVMTGVSKTTDLSDTELKAMGEAIKDLSVNIPVTTEQLGGIGEVAGQLGIADDYLLDFSTTMAMLATATKMTAEEGATMLAQFANITQMDPSQYQNLASAVVALGNSYATTEQNIVSMAQGVAASGSISGMSEADIVGLSAAVTSLGIESAAGSTSMSKLISELNTAVETGEGLTNLAAIANMSADAFKTAWGSDAASTLAAFVSGLSDVERNGKSATVVLQDLGITEAREQRMVLSLSKSGSLLARTLQTSRSAWRENTALADEASKRYATTESQMTMAQSAVNNLKIAVGDNLTPVLQTLLPVGTDVLSGVTQFIEENPALVQAIITAAAVFGTVTIAIVAYSAAAKIAAAASTLLSASIPGLNVVLAVTAGVAALTAGAVALNSAIQESAYDFQELDGEFDGINEQLADQMQVADLCDEYERLNKELGNTSGLRQQGKAIQSVTDSAAKLKGYDGTKVTLTAEMANTLSASGFMDGTVVQLTAEQANFLAAEGFLTGTTVILTAETGSKLAAAGMLDDTTVELTAEAANALAAAGFLDSSKVSLTAEKGNTLTASGYLDGTTVKLTAEMANFLAAKGFLDGTKVSLTAEMANKLQAAGYMADSTVQLTAEAANALAAAGFLDGSTVSLTAEQANTLIAAGYLDASTVSLTATAGNTIASSEFFDDTTVSITAELGNYTDVESKLISLQDKVNEAAAALEAEKSTLTELETKYTKLQALLNGEGEKSDVKDYQSKKGLTADGIAGKKTTSALRDDLAALDTEIDTQKGKVSDLEATYTRLNDEYTTTKTTVEELTAKQQRYAEVKQLLIDNSGGLITATDTESEAFERQVAALAGLTDAKVAEEMQKAYQNIEAQSKGYIDALNEEVKYQNLLNEAQQRQSISQGAVTLGLDGMKAKVTGIYDDLIAKADEVNENGIHYFDTDEGAAYLDQQIGKAQELMKIMSGADYDYAGPGLGGLVTAMDTLNFSASAIQEAWISASADVTQYNQSLQEAQDSQKSYLDNLVNYVRLSGMSDDSLSAILTERYGSLENGSTIVANAMSYVQSALQSAVEVDTLAQSEEQAASNSILLQEAIDGATTGVKKLSDAYNEAYDSAHSSMEGQFGLFEKVGKASENIGVNTMIDRLNKQAEYMETYTTNLQKAKEAGLSDELISSLSDGSAESAQALENILTTAEKSPEKIAQLNEAFASVQTGKDQFSTTVATMETDLQTSMNNLVTTTETAVGKLDLSTDAATNAKNTVQGFIDKVDDMHDEVAAAAVALANAFNTAFKSTQIIGSPSKLYRDYGEYTVQGYIGGIEDMQADAEATMSSFAIAGLEAFKSQNTGLSAWGLQPETATPVSALQREGDFQLHLSVSPQYSISGTSDSGSIEAVLRAHNDELREMVLDVLNEAGVDSKRKGYD